MFGEENVLTMSTAAGISSMLRVLNWILTSEFIGELGFHDMVIQNSYCSEFKKDEEREIGVSTCQQLKRVLQ